MIEMPLICDPCEVTDGDICIGQCVGKQRYADQQAHDKWLEEKIRTMEDLPALDAPILPLPVEVMAYYKGAQDKALQIIKHLKGLK